MQGISIQTDSAGNPTVLTVDLSRLDERLKKTVNDLLHEVEELESDRERAFWHRLGAENLSRAYGNDEPDYSTVAYQSLNPQFNSEHERR